LTISKSQIRETPNRRPLYPTIPRLEAALGEPTCFPCPQCRALVFAPGWWCEDCQAVAFPSLLLDADYEDNGDAEPDDDYG
jgi:hypothetical protein